MLSKSSGIISTKRRFFKYANPSTGLSSGQYIADMDDNNYYNIIWFRRGDTAPSTPVIPLCTSMKTMVGYSFVTDSIPGIGTHLYCYCNFEPIAYNSQTGIQPHNPQMEVGNFQADFGKREFMRGKLTNEYIKDGNGFLQQSVRYEYRTDAALYEKMCIYGFDNKAYLLPYNAPHKGIVKLYYPKYDLQRVATSTLYGSLSVNDTVTYSMMDFNSPVDNRQPSYFRKCAAMQSGRMGNRVTEQHSYSYVQPNCYFLPRIATSTLYNGVLQQEDQTIYSSFNGTYHPKYEVVIRNGGLSDTTVTYHSYTNNGLLQSYTQKGEYPTQLFWNDKDQLLASVTSAITGGMNIYEGSPLFSPSLDSILVINPESPSFVYNGLSPLDVVKYQGLSIFCYPEVKATTYVYGTHGLPIATATGNGIVTYYLYSSEGQLSRVLNSDMKCTKRYSRHYATESTQ